MIANSHFISGLIEDRHPFAKGKITVIQRGSDLKGLLPDNVSALRLQALKDQWASRWDGPILLTWPG